MIENKKLNIFTYILFAISCLILLFAYFIDDTHAMELSDKWRTLSNYVTPSGFYTKTLKTPNWNNTPDNILNEVDGQYVLPIELLSYIDPNNPTDRYNAQYLDNITFNTDIEATNNSFCSPRISSSGCSVDIGFTFNYSYYIPDNTPNLEYSLQQSISYILANYNNVLIDYNIYNSACYSDFNGTTCQDNQTIHYTNKLNTKVLGESQYVVYDNNGNRTGQRYVLSIYYTFKIDNLAYNPNIIFQTNEMSSQSYDNIFLNNNLYWNTDINFYAIAYNYTSGSSGIIPGQDGVDSDADKIIQSQKETQQKLEDIERQLADTTPPDTSGLGGSAGWLPAGPVDSILNLPLTFFQGLNNALATTCSPVNVPLPFVNQSVQLPCVNTLFNQINGFNTWWTAMGLIASAFILYKYLLHLYQWVDDTLTFRENNWQDWGGI